MSNPIEILLVEDNPVNRRLAGFLLRSQGYEGQRTLVVPNELLMSTSGKPAGQFRKKVIRKKKINRASSSAMPTGTVIRSRRKRSSSTTRTT